MIEVYKTDITDSIQASILADQIHRRFSEYTVNFDLDDCDRIMRIVCSNGEIASEQIIKFVKVLGFHAEILQDEITPESTLPILPSRLTFFFH